jgi:Tfp pilus assembly protein PilO
MICIFIIIFGNLFYFSNKNNLIADKRREQETELKIQLKN